MDGDREFPTPLSKFARTLVGTADEVWTRLLRINHGRENHTAAEWNALIDTYRPRRVHPDGHPQAGPIGIAAPKR